MSKRIKTWGISDDFWEPLELLVPENLRDSKNVQAKARGRKKGQSF